MATKRQTKITESTFGEKRDQPNSVCLFGRNGKDGHITTSQSRQTKQFEPGKEYEREYMTEMEWSGSGIGIGVEL